MRTLLALTTDPTHYSSHSRMVDETSDGFTYSVTWTTDGTADRCDHFGTEEHDFGDCLRCGERPRWTRALEGTAAFPRTPVRHHLSPS